MSPFEMLKLIGAVLPGSIGVDLFMAEVRTGEMRRISALSAGRPRAGAALSPTPHPRRLALFLGFLRRRLDR